MSFKKNARKLVQTDEGFRAFVRLVNLRRMVAHRGISLEQLVQESGKTEDWVKRTLTGLGFWKTLNFDRNVDMLETAITSITARKDSICPCSQETIEYLRHRIEVLSDNSPR